MIQQAPSQEELKRSYEINIKNREGQLGSPNNNECCSTQSPNGRQRIEELQKKFYSQAEDLQIILNMLPSVLSTEQQYALIHLSDKLKIAYNLPLY